MKKIIPLIFSVLYIINSNAQAVGGWGNCEFATVATMNAFDPSTNAYDCKKVFVQATDEHYHWDGTQWVLDTDTENIYNADGTLTTNRTMTMDGNNLTFDGTGSGNVVIKSNGHIGIRVPDPQANLHVGGDARIRLQQAASGGNVEARYDLNAGGDGKFYLENKNNATVPFAITKTDNVGIGTTTPNAKLDVEGGTVRFSDYGAGTNSGTVTQMLGVEADGDIIEIDASNAAGTGAMDNIYTTDGTVQANRTVDLDGKNLTFAGTNDVFIESTGRVGVGTSSPAEELHVVGDTKVSKHLYVGANAASGSTVTMRVRENYSTDQSTYQIYSIPTITSPVLANDRTSYGVFSRILNNKTENIAGGFDSDAVGGSFRSYISGTKTFRTLYGVQGYAYNQSTAASNLGNLYGGYFRVYNNAASGTIPTTYGSYSYVSTINGKGGDITNAYGVYGRVRVDSDDGGDIATGRAGYFLTDKRTGANLMTTAYGLQVDANDGVTTYGIRIDADDADPTTNYGLYIDSYNATTNNYGIFGERGDWVLDQDGDGVSGGTGSGGDLVLGEGQDLELYHDGTNSNIINNTGDLIITDVGTDDVIISTNGGNTGIGTTSPDAKLDVEGGTVRFSDYGAGTNSGTETYILGVEADGDVVEIDASTLGSTDNIYTVDGTLGANRTVDMDGKTLIFDGAGTGDVIIEADGDVGIGTTAPTQKLHVAGSHKVQIGDFGGSGGGKLRVDISDGEAEVQAIKTMVLQTSGTNYAINGTAAGVGATTNVALYGYAAGATNNHGLWINSGYGNFNDKVAIGTAGLVTPQSMLEVTYDRNSSFTVAEPDDGTNKFLSPIVGLNESNASWSRTITGLTPNVPDGDVSGLFTFGQGDATRQAGHMYFVDRGADGDEYVGFGVRSGAWNILNMTGNGDVGIGTITPDAKLDVEGGTVRFSDYGAGTNSGTETYILGVEADGDVIEIDASTLGTDNIYTVDGTLGANRTVDMDGKTLIFDGAGTGDVIIEADGDVGIGTVAPTEKLEVAGSVKIKNNLYAQDGKHVVSTPWHSYANVPAGEYLVLSTPIVHNEGNMFRLDIEFYDYNGTEKAGTIVCTGYAYAAGSLLNVDCHTIGITRPIYLTKEVRADQGGQEVIVAYIGNLSSNFYFPQATVRYSGWKAKDPVDFKWSTQSAPVPAGNYNNSYIEDHSGDSYFNAGDVGIGTTSPDAKLDVENGTVRFSDYGAGTNGGTSTRVLGVDVDGDVIEMNTAKSSRIFYPPALAIVADVVGTSFTLDLHQEYIDLFGTPAIKSTGAPVAIPTYLETELYYYITDYDTDVFENVSVNASGVMTYDVKAAASDNCSFMNVIFVVKEP